MSGAQTKPNQQMQPPPFGSSGGWARKWSPTCSLLYNIRSAGCGGKAHKNCPRYGNGSFGSARWGWGWVAATGVVPFVVTVVGTAVVCKTTVVVASGTGWTEFECSSRLRSLLQQNGHVQSTCFSMVAWHRPPPDYAHNILFCAMSVN